MTKIEYYVDTEYPDATGWFIVEYDLAGESYDRIGPYDTPEEAKALVPDAEIVNVTH